MAQASASISSKPRQPGTTVIGTGKVPACPPPTRVVTSGPGPEGSLEAPSTKTPISVSSSISLVISSCFHPLTHELLRLDILEAHGLQFPPEQAEHGARLVEPFLARDLLDTEKMGNVGVGLDHIEERELPLGAERAARGEGERAFAFRRLVDYDEKFALVPFGEDLALHAAASRLQRLLSSRVSLLLGRHGGACCHHFAALSWGAAARRLSSG